MSIRHVQVFDGFLSFAFGQDSNEQSWVVQCDQLFRFNLRFGWSVTERRFMWKWGFPGPLDEDPLQILGGSLEVAGERDGTGEKWIIPLHGSTFPFSATGSIKGPRLAKTCSAARVTIKIDLCPPLGIGRIVQISLR